MKKLLHRIYRKLTKKTVIQDKKHVSHWFNKVLGNSAANLVQIGSNDGKTGDPLYPLLQKHIQWKALFVEPVPYLFNRLRGNYPDSNRFQVENVAIGNEASMVFYWVDPVAKDHLPDLPYWYDQLGSFDRNHIVKHLDGVLEPYILSEEIKCIKLNELLLNSGYKSIDILHIDTEGYDWQILSQLDLSKYKPKFVLYEYHHLSPTDLAASKKFLEKEYDVYQAGIDYLAVRKDVVPSQLGKYLTKV